MAENTKKEKVSLGKRISQFFRNYKSEIKKIVWPTPQETFKNTAFVLVVVIVVGLIVAGLDLGFSYGIIGLSKLVG